MSYFCNFLEEFWWFFYKCLVEFPCEAIWFWTFVCGGLLHHWFHFITVNELFILSICPSFSHGRLHISRNLSILFLWKYLYLYPIILFLCCHLTLLFADFIFWILTFFFLARCAQLKVYQCWPTTEWGQVLGINRLEGGFQSGPCQQQDHCSKTTSPKWLPPASLYSVGVLT